MRAGKTVLIAMLMLEAANVQAQTVPEMINYQGRLVDSTGTPLAPANYTLTGSLWTAAQDGSNLWREVHSNTPVVQGYCSLILGQVNTNGLTDALEDGAQYIEVTGPGGARTGRQRLLSVPFATSAGSGGLVGRTYEATSSVTMSVRTVYIANTASNACELTLPAKSRRGDTLLVIGQGAAGWKVKSNPDAQRQRILRRGSVSSTSSNNAIDLAVSAAACDSLWLMCTAPNETWTVIAGEGGTFGNYFGDGTDLTLTLDTNLLLAVTKTNGPFDGDMVVKHYDNLTILEGGTLTVDHPCRGLLIYCRGDCIVNGTLSMTGKGALADPTQNGGSDGRPVGANGLVFRRHCAGGAASNADTNLLYGCGSNAVAAEAHQKAVENGVVLTIPRIGAAATGSYTTVDYEPDPEAGHKNPGNDGRGGQTGGGGSGGAVGAGSPYSATAGGGGAGTCFSGGAGGGGCATAWRVVNSFAGAGLGGAGGNGYVDSHCGADNGDPYRCWNTVLGGGGGAGNPGGKGYGKTGTEDGETGTGGILILIVRGNLTIGPSGSIQADGKRGGQATGIAGWGSAGGGGSGGGSVILMHAGSFSNLGSVRANGGAGGDATGQFPERGGAGGDGSVQTAHIDP